MKSFVIITLLLLTTSCGRSPVGLHPDSVVARGGGSYVKIYR